MSITARTSLYSKDFSKTEDSYTIVLSTSETSKLKLATIVKGNQKAPFSIATTPRCRDGTTPFPGLLHHFTLDTYLILLSVKQGGIKYHF